VFDVRRGLFPAVVTVLFAGAAAAGVFLFMKNVRQDAEKPTPMIGVVVSTRDIPANQNLDPLIDQNIFTTRSVPSDLVIDGVITDVYQLRGQRTAYPILAGEQISAARLAGDLQVAGGILGIPDGYQAASLTLEGQRSVSGAVREGDHVEVFGTFMKNDNQTTRVMIPDALVLAPGNAANENTLTLAVTPQDAARLIYAQEQGHVWLTLLPPNEHGVQVPPVTSKAVR
jgi:Flp pilus assembly protein CpaB